MKQKLLSILALLLMVATQGARAQADMKKTPLTLEAKTAGTIEVFGPQSGMQYSKNGGAKTELTADAGYNSGNGVWTITVAAGETVQLYGNGTSITSYGSNNVRIAYGTADVYIYGNIMSLVDEENFATATTLTDDDAFSYLFSYNSQLYNHDTYELVLPATTLAARCYQAMFSDCTNLTTAPALPATTLAEGCYSGMFTYCTNLTTAPVLPATTLADYCYYNMFNGCTKLNSVTCLATDISADYALDNWLYGVAADGTFTKAPGMEGWTTNSASGIPDGWTVVDNVVLTDMKETPLTLKAKTAGTILVMNPREGMQYKKNDEAKTAVTSAPIDVAIGDKVQFFGNGTSIKSYYGMDDFSSTKIGVYADCYIYGNIMSLVDEENFATATTLTGDRAFDNLFSGNSQLYNHDTYELVLPATTLAFRCYQGMFSNCTNLTTAPELPATTLAEGCYSGMFVGCTNLTTAPVLPAGTLEVCCYEFMFDGCTKLNSVTCLATNISATDATISWLNFVAADGTFTKAAGVTGWSSDDSGIPSGWTVVDNVVLTDGDDLSALSAYAGQSYEVTYKRAFTADKPSTVCLPFAYAPKTGEKFYTFSGITKDGDEYVATMTEHTGATLEANTPYLYKSATTGVTDFSGTYTIPATIAAGTTTSGDWKFVGTYETQEWTTAPTGIYGFSAQNTTGGISQGEFVKVGAYVRIKPMRAYLKYKDGGDDYTGAPMMAPRRAAETLPERISVRLIDADGEVTGIGTLETRTGEVTLDGWYTLDGTRLSGQPTRKGIYVNNGKKVIIK